MRILIDSTFVTCTACDGEEFFPAQGDTAPAGCVRCTACGHEAGYDELFMRLRAEAAQGAGSHGA